MSTHAFPFLGLPASSSDSISGVSPARHSQDRSSGRESFENTFNKARESSRTADSRDANTTNRTQEKPAETERVRTEQARPDHEARPTGEQESAQNQSSVQEQEGQKQEGNASKAVSVDAVANESSVSAQQSVEQLSQSNSPASGLSLTPAAVQTDKLPTSDRAALQGEVQPQPVSESVLFDTSIISGTSLPNEKGLALQDGFAFNGENQAIFSSGAASLDATEAGDQAIVSSGVLRTASSVLTTTPVNSQLSSDTDGMAVPVTEGKLVDLPPQASRFGSLAGVVSVDTETAAKTALSNSNVLTSDASLTSQATASDTVDSMFKPATQMASTHQLASQLNEGQARFAKLLSDVLPDASVDSIESDLGGLAEGSQHQLKAGQPFSALHSAERPFQISAFNGKISIQSNVTVGQAQWPSAIAERAAWLVSQTIQSAEIQLDPPELGPLNVKIHVQNDQAAVSFTASSTQVKDALDQTLVRLRELLQEQGLQLVDAGVSDQGQQRGTGDNETSHFSDSEMGADHEGELDAQQLVLHVESGIDTYI